MSRIDKAISAAVEKRNQAEKPPLSPPQKPSVTLPRKPLKEEQRSAIVSNPLIVTANDRTSPASEQYRKLKSLVIKLLNAENFDRSLMLTSSVAGEGKSITSLNLAITLAQEFDHSVLLVEADIRKPAIMNYLEYQRGIGLTDCVLDDIDLNEAIIKTGIGSLSILPAGRSVSNPVELFSSNRMKEMFDEIKTRYDDRYLIVDTTPLLPFAEPIHIANMVDAVMMVVREGVTTPEKLKNSLEILKSHNLLGVVSNCVSRINSLQGYYGYYGYDNDSFNGKG